MTVWTYLKSALSRPKSIKAWSPSEGMSVFDILKKIDADVRFRQYEQALRTLLATYENLNIGNSGLLYEWLSRWSKLSKVYAPAKRAYINRRNDAESKSWSDISSRDRFAEACAFNEMIEQDHRTIRLFRKIAKRDVQAAGQLYFRIEDIYIALGWWSGDPYLDTTKLLEHGAHPISLTAYCAATIVCGYYLFRSACVEIWKAGGNQPTQAIVPLQDSTEIS